MQSSPIVRRRGRFFHFNVVVDEHLCYLAWTDFPIPPINSPLRQPTSLLVVLTFTPLYMYVLVGGVGVVIWSPSLPSDSDVISVLSTPSNLAASTETTSSDVPVSLSIWILTVVSVNTVPIPIFLSYVVSPVAAPLNLLFLDESKVTHKFPMNMIIFSHICPHKGACECMHCLMHSPLVLKRIQISLPSTAMGKRRFPEHAADISSPNLSIICSCGSIPMLCTVSLPPSLLLIQDPLPCPSNFCRPSSFGVVWSTHTYFVIKHSPLSIFSLIPPTLPVPPIPRLQWK